MSSDIEVYILCTQKERCSSRSDLTNLFSNSQFKINFITTTSEQDAAFRAIQDANRSAPGKSIILIKDTSVSASSARIIDKVVKDAEKIRGWDLLYLGGVTADCQEDLKYIPISGTGVSLIPTNSVLKMNAVMLPSYTIDMILGSRKMNNGESFPEVTEGTFEERLYQAQVSEGLRSLNTYPPLFMVEPSLAAEVCRDYKGAVSNEGGFNWVPLVIFILMMLLLGMVGYYIYNKQKQCPVQV